MAVSNERWSVWADQRITRRKYFHTLLDPSGQQRLASRHLGECVDFLLAEDQLEFTLHCPETPPIVCRISPPSQQE